MSPHDPRLWATAGAALLWLVIAWLQARARQALPRPRGTVRVYALGSGLWFTAVAVVLLGPVAGLIVLWLIPFEPDSRLTAAALLGLYAGVSGAVGLTLLRLEVRTDDHGLIAPDLWGVPAFLPWLRVRSVQLRFESLCFLGGGRRLYVPVMLNAWPQFLAELEQRLPQLALPPELTRSRSLREDPERAAQESQLQGLYDHAERIAAGALLAVGVSLAWVEPHPTALAWAALGGLGLAAYPLARPWLPAKPGWLGELIGFVGMLFAFAANHALSLYEARHPPAHPVAWEWSYLVVLIQVLGTLFAVPLLLIALAKRLWPHRYARTRLNDV